MKNSLENPPGFNPGLCPPNIEHYIDKLSIDAERVPSGLQWN
jgi:hypothetical protein